MPETTAERLREAVAEVNAARGAPARPAPPTPPGTSPARAAALELLRSTPPDQLAGVLAEALRGQSVSAVRPLAEMAPEELREFRNRLLPGWALGHLPGAGQ